jgi:hypothetical protein
LSEVPLRVSSGGVFSLASRRRLDQSLDADQDRQHTEQTGISGSQNERDQRHGDANDDKPPDHCPAAWAGHFPWNIAQLPSRLAPARIDCGVLIDTVRECFRYALKAQSVWRGFLQFVQELLVVHHRVLRMHHRDRTQYWTDEQES